jgi:Protein of unknown function (DUF4239)/Protein of unknown function (DUF3365)
MTDWLLDLHVAWMAVVVAIVTYAVTGGLYALVIGLAHGDRARAFKSVSPGMLPPLGIVFGLFVAFIASQVWSDMDRAATAVNREASALGAVGFLAASFPGQPEARLHDLIRRHIDVTVTREWPMMAQRSVRLEVTPPSLSEALQLALALKIDSAGQATAQREIATALENAIDARRQRIIISRSEVSGVKWLGLIVLAICTLLAIGMVHSDNRQGAAIAMGIFATGVAVAVLIIAAHDRPFGGDIAVSPAPLLQVMPEEAVSERAAGHAIAIDVAQLLRAARQVISDQQDLINRPGTGKPLTAGYVIDAAQSNYANTTGHELPVLDPASEEGWMLQAELQAIQAVMDEAQPLINDPDRGFKGFIPVVFAQRVAVRFSKTMHELAFLRVTAPPELVRNPANEPDGWESAVIQDRFRSPDWHKGDFVAEEAALNGKRAFRLLIPEYYDASCLACHGEPKGAIDITGGKKEGGKLGDLGGAISASIYLQ